MDIYSVTDVSKMLDVNDETVRRWIRGGKLDGAMSSRKNGVHISYDSLVKFLSEPEHLKYNRNVGVDTLVQKIKNSEKKIDILRDRIAAEEKVLAHNRELLSGLVSDGIWHN